MKFLNKQQSSIPPLHHQGTTANSDHEKATMLNDFFSTCFNRTVPPLVPPNGDLNLHNDECPDDLLCLEGEVLTYIRLLDAAKASGPDGLSSRMLKGTANSIAPSLTRLFNISIKLGRFPKDWKTFSVVPIPKISNHKEATNYRPISLLPIVSKMLERHIHQYITTSLSVTNPLSNGQWGFQTGRSTITALLSVTHEWFKVLESGQELFSVFFDIKKTFDTVPHQSLMDKLHRYSLDPHIQSWLNSYLSDRMQHVVVGGALSPDTPVVLGVPQGSVLGPLLFLIYIDDLSTIGLSEGSVLNLFADDMLLYRPIGSSEDLQQIQSDVDRVNEWVISNHLSLNPVKCKTMLITKKINPIQPLQLQLNGIPLEQVEHFKYLGVLFSSDLSWSTHIDSICSKARKLVGLLYRRFSANVDSQPLLEMYKLLVRPHLEYAAQIWNPHLVKNITKLEDIQTFALRMCYKNWDAGYQELLDLTTMPTLENRRLYLKLCSLYKIIYSHFYFPPNVFTAQPSRTPLVSPLLNQPHARTNYYQSSFVPSTISVWNNLPHTALTAHTTQSFKAHIAPFFL